MSNKPMRPDPDAVEILRLHERIQTQYSTCVDWAIECGKKLDRKRASMKRGEWSPWMKRHLSDISERTVQVYIQCWENKDTLKNGHALSIREGLRLIADKDERNPQRAAANSKTPSKKASNQCSTECSTAPEDPIKQAEKDCESRHEEEESEGVVTHEDEVRRDELGNVIGEPTLPEWDAGLSAQDALNHLAKAKGIVNSLWKSNERVFAGKSVNHGAMLEALEAARMKIKEIVPYAVCAQCNGSKKRDKCPLCLGRGYLSKFYYDSYLAQETKDEQAARR